MPTASSSRANPATSTLRRGSFPALLGHRGFPLLASRQHFVLRATDLGLHDLKLAANEQQHLPSELVRAQLARRLTAILMQNEQLSLIDG
jgi:hypothetical protein